MKTAALLVTLTGFLVSCASTQPVGSGRAGDSTMTLDEKTGLIVGIDGKPLTTEQIKTRQRAALDAPRTASTGKSGGGFGAWLKEWYSVENIQKRMAIGAMAGAAASHAYTNQLLIQRLSQPPPPQHIDIHVIPANGYHVPNLYRPY